MQPRLAMEKFKAELETTILFTISVKLTRGNGFCRESYDKRNR